MQGVSVIIPTFNRAEKLVRAVSSVLSQSAQAAEVIIVDDGSTDHTESTLAPFIDRITYVRHPANRGVSAARNTGIRQAGGEFIAFLDSDDHWLKDKLAVQTQFFTRYPDVVACQTEEIWIRGGRRVNPKKIHIKPSGEIFVASLKLCLVSPSAVMLRRTLMDEVGMFDERLPACEDYDLWLRISCRYPIQLIPECLVVKEGGAPDQLSARYPGMDRFRIQAMVKLLQSETLSEGQRGATLEELALKCRIYGNGCLKRGKTEEGRYYLNLPAELRAGRENPRNPVGIPPMEAVLQRISPPLTGGDKGEDE